MPRGVIVRTPERVELARELREDGKTYQEIGDLLGVSYQAAFEWVNDPDGTARRARRAGYAGTCVGCGAKTCGSGARSRSAPRRCRTCAGAHIRQQSRDWIIASVHEWIERFGEPPTALDWNPALARSRGRSEVIARAAATGRPWPATSLAQEHFGSWNNALAAAGVAPIPVGQRRDPAEHKAKVRRLHGTDAVEAAIAEGWRAGLSGREIADQAGIKPTRVYARISRMRKDGWDLPYRRPGWLAA